MDISSLLFSVICSGLGARDTEIDYILPCGLMKEAMVQGSWGSPLLALHRGLLELQLGVLVHAGGASRKGTLLSACKNSSPASCLGIFEYRPPRPRYLRPQAHIQP